MKPFFFGPLLCSVFSFCLLSAEPSYRDPSDQKVYYPAPSVTLDELDLPTGLPAWRLAIIEAALQTRQKLDWPKYLFGSADPKKGGFDCSGAMYYILKQAGYQPARTSSNQYLWLQKESVIYPVSEAARNLEDPSFRFLKPGDLVFWSGTYEPTDGRTIPITHVGLYLGALKGYERPVMICASKGRYFKGKRRDGYGVYDFKLPSQKSRAKLVAYGSLSKIDRKGQHQ